MDENPYQAPQATEPAEQPRIAQKTGPWFNDPLHPWTIMVLVGLLLLLIVGALL